MIKIAKLGAVILLLTLLALPALDDLFKPGYFASHDGIGHVVRLSEFDIAIRDGAYPPRLSKNLMYGYGYYFFNFNYPLVYYLGEGVHLLGLGFAESLKVVIGVGLVLSGIAMYLWQKRHFGFWGGLLAALFYMYAPYRLLNIYVRGSVAEHLAFIFLPVLFLFTEKIVEGKSQHRNIYVLAGGVAYALLMLSHNIMAFIFTLVLGMFMVFHLILYRNWKAIFSFAAIGIIGLSLSAYFWIPSILEKKFVRLDQTIGQDYPAHFVEWWQLIIPSWGYGGSVSGPNDGLSFQIGLLHLLVLALSLAAAIILWKRRHNKAAHISFYVVVFFLAVFLMLPVSKFVWRLVPLLPFTQFPWRFLSWTVFACSVLAGAMVFFVHTKYENKWRVVAPLFTIFAGSVLILISSPYWHAQRRVSVKMVGDHPINGSTTWADEQFPIWFNPKPKSIPKERVELVLGKGQVQIKQWKTGYHQYIVNVQDPLFVVENTAYYPGWVLRINGDPTAQFTYQEKKYPGRILYPLFPGTYVIETIFTETPLRLMADGISVLTIFGVVVAFCLIIVKGQLAKK